MVFTLRPITNQLDQFVDALNWSTSKLVVKILGIFHKMHINWCLIILNLARSAKLSGRHIFKNNCDRHSLHEISLCQFCKGKTRFRCCGCIHISIFDNKERKFYIHNNFSLRLGVRVKLTRTQILSKRSKKWNLKSSWILLWIKTYIHW